jgi:hypothetical protein
VRNLWAFLETQRLIVKKVSEDDQAMPVDLVSSSSSSSTVVIDAGDEKSSATDAIRLPFLVADLTKMEKIWESLSTLWNSRFPKEPNAWLHEAPTPKKMGEEVTLLVKGQGKVAEEIGVLQLQVI